jgi:hypothetical protein
MFKKWFKKKQAVTDTPPQQEPDMTDSHTMHLLAHQVAMKQAVHSVAKHNLAPTTLQVSFTGTPTIKQCRDMLDLWHSSNFMGNINSMAQNMERGFAMNKLEQAMMDELIEKYNAIHKSPLAKSMSEDDTNE